MRKQAIVCVLLLGAALAFAAPVRAQQIEITEMAGLAQIFGEAQDNDVPLSMNDMDMVSGGYLLYETEVEAWRTYVTMPQCMWAKNATVNSRTHIKS